MHGDGEGGGEGGHRQFCLPRLVHVVITCSRGSPKETSGCYKFQGLRTGREQHVPESSDHSLYLIKLFNFRNFEETAESVLSADTHTPTHTNTHNTPQDTTPHHNATHHTQHTVTNTYTNTRNDTHTQTHTHTHMYMHMHVYMSMYMFMKCLKQLHVAKKHCRRSQPSNSKKVYIYTSTTQDSTARDSTSQRNPPLLLSSLFSSLLSSLLPSYPVSRQKKSHNQFSQEKHFGSCLEFSRNFGGLSQDAGRLYRNFRSKSKTPVR